jgi:chromosome segregation ATPase
MSFLQEEINHLQEEIEYHEEQIELLDKKIDNIRIAQEYANQAISSVEDALESLEPVYIHSFKEYLLSIFDQEVIQDTPQLLEEDCHPNVELVERIVEEDTAPTVEVEEESYEVVQLSENIYYSHTDQVAYLGFSNKGRARIYGDYLCGTHTVGTQYPLVTS